MKQPLLSTSLTALRDHFGPYGATGMECAPHAVQRLVGMLDAFAEQAADLERAAHRAEEYEAIARDLDPIAALRASRAAAAMQIPGSNVVTFPVTSRRTPNNGDAA